MGMMGTARLLAAGCSGPGPWGSSRAVGSVGAWLGLELWLELGLALELGLELEVGLALELGLELGLALELSWGWSWSC